MTRQFVFLAAVAITVFAPANPSSAQATIQAVPGTTIADRLGDEMRKLAANPRDVDALLKAGEFSIDVGDLSGAASLFARAEQIDPDNARSKAGMASILVRSEQPGAALRLFQQAEAKGINPAAFASDRGLAYDLIGQQSRAERDYRTALSVDPQDEEALRRYALSLGIAGSEKPALDLLTPLLRKQDHAAWRARAFILAMNGDQAEAVKIAKAMMPPAMASGLLPFFERLPSLPAVDRAFAVHFGEVHPTAQRIADAKLAPYFPPPTVRGVEVAAAPVPLPKSRKRTNDARRAVAVSRSTPLVRPVAVVPVPTSRPSVNFSAPPTLPPAPPEQIAAAAPSVAPRPDTRVLSPMGEKPAVPLAVTQGRPNRLPATISANRPVTAGDPVTIAGPAVPVQRDRTRIEADAVLSRIVAGLSIPSSELGIVGPQAPAQMAAAGEPAPDPATKALAEAEAKTARDTAARAAVAEKLAADKQAALDRKKAAADKAVALKKAAAEKKALADKKAADEKKAAEAKEKAEARKAEKANPSRIWVQVAGGANEGDLAKTWAAVKAKAGKLLASKTGWSTPLRATNRVLTGPFKTSDEARDLVNALAKDGISAFPFTSDAAQIVTKLPGR